jgi:hypothetical protein
MRRTLCRNATGGKKKRRGAASPTHARAVWSGARPGKYLANPVGGGACLQSPEPGMDEKKDAINSLGDRFQLAGLDDRQRGFSRPVDIDPVKGQYRARLRYESTQIVTAPAATEAGALLELIHDLHAQGYRQLKTQLSFRRGTYLGSQEPWIEYADPTPDRGWGLLSTIRNWFHGSD